MSYQQKIALEIGTPGQDFRRWEGLRVSARVKKTSNSSPNTAEIEVYNLSENSVSEAQKDGASVRLFAGFEDTGTRLVFVGTINRDGATEKKEGPTRVLSLQAKDGGLTYAGARVNKTYDRAVKVSEIIDDLANQTGLPRGAIELEQDAQLTQGVTLVGPISKVFDRLRRLTKAQWSIQDGELQFLPNSAVRQDQAVLVSSKPPSLNLVGSPAPSKDGLEVKALLDGRFLPGSRIQLESENFNGIYRIQSLEHVLDSGWDTPFFTEMLCREV